MECGANSATLTLRQRLHIDRACDVDSLRASGQRRVHGSRLPGPLVEADHRAIVVARRQPAMAEAIDMRAIAKVRSRTPVLLQLPPGVT